ncbi:MAG: hypothetical protein COA79_20535 [Planctomycetota bacterium]|nr:MAG: hypothetical protein COA79_20535 [Planctomycetota bacterium]
MSKYKGISVDGECIEVKVSGKIIESVANIDVDKSLPLIAVPLVDTQNNGALGIGYNNCSDKVDQFSAMARFSQSHGIGKILLTTTTCPAERLQKSGKAISDFFDKNEELKKFFSGVFHEGIYMSKQDGWRGAHSLEYIKDPDYEEFKETNKCFNNTIKLVNIAPEEPGALGFIEKAVSDGVRVSIGHACPNAEEVANAVKCGATMVTHFGNGAHTTVHRHHNPFWSFLAHDELSLGIIADSHHLPVDIISTVFKAKTKDKVNLVSDCSSITGFKAGNYGETGVSVTLEKDGYLHITGEEILAGAWHQLDKGVEVLCQMGWELKDAWKQCSEMPAKQFDIDLTPIAAGEPADFVLSSYSNENGLVLSQVVMDGEEIKPLPVNPVED